MALTVQHTDLATAVAASLRSAIVSGELPAGSRLVETELANQFGVSRGPVRDALAELQRSGLVELQARKGSFVRSLTAIDVQEVYSLRIALESLAIRRAIDIGGDLLPLPALVDELTLAHRAGDRSRIGAADMALHRGVVAAAAHTRLLEAWGQLADQTLLMMTTLPSLDPDLQGPTGAHRLIIDRLVSGDAEAAVTAMTEHLEQAAGVIAAQFED